MDSALPPLVQDKQLASGETAFYFTPKPSDRKKGLKLSNERLDSRDGALTDKGRARAAELYKAVTDWREGKDGDGRAAKGTLNWLIAVYMADRRFLNRSEATQKNYAYNLKRLAGMTGKSGQTLGQRRLKEFTPEVCDKIYERIVEECRDPERGITGLRTAGLMMTNAATAWNVGRRKDSETVPAENPFEGVYQEYEAQETQEATYDQLELFVIQALEMDMPEVAWAARMCWDLLQRPIDLPRYAWAYYRPANRPDQLFALSTKNSGSAWLYASHYDSQTEDTILFYPEVDELFAMIPRRGPKVLMKPKLKGRQKTSNVIEPWSQRFLEKQVGNVRAAASLPDYVTLAAFRHGGNTELGDAELTDAEALNLTRHRRRETLSRYIHRTERQALSAQMKRLQFRSAG